MWRLNEKSNGASREESVAAASRKRSVGRDESKETSRKGEVGRSRKQAGRSRKENGRSREEVDTAMKRGMLLVALILAAGLARGADNLKINPHLDYSDHNRKQGPLITGDDMDDGVVKGKPNYIYFYMEKCYNAKRQARITVHQYDRYRDFVHFVIIDLDQPVNDVQKALINKYCFKVIPHTTLLDKDGTVVLDYTGETDEPTMAGWVDYIVRTAQGEEQAGSSKPGSQGGQTGQSGQAGQNGSAGQPGSSEPAGDGAKGQDN